MSAFLSSSIKAERGKIRMTCSAFRQQQLYDAYPNKETIEGICNENGGPYFGHCAESY